MATAKQELPPLTPAEVDSPIINSPFVEPKFNWQIEKAKPPVKAPGRRRASYFYRVPEHAGRGRKSKPTPDMFEAEKGEQVDLTIVNEIRTRIKDWRNGVHSAALAYDGASSVTKELLELWRSEDRMQRLFFAQIEAVETIIFLIEANEIYRKGLPEIPKDEPGLDTKAAGFRAFVRYACKMATGSGKTTVMGMLAAWSILNRVASPTDDRFTDTLLIVCPNVTIRERLQELDPALGDLSLYRTRQLVPPHRMEELRRGEVMIANWHRLAKKETNTVNGDSAKVVKTGEPVEVVKNAGKENESVEVKYFESDAAWFKRIRLELGSGKGRSPHWLVFNDEAHHAYRRGDVTGDEQSLDEDKDLAKKNDREATIWIEGLDRINKLAGGSRRRGINLCVDLSATPFCMQAAIGSLLEAIKKGAKEASVEVAVIPQGAAGRGSTLFVDFHTTKPIYPVAKCHLNAMVADTQKWEQSAGFLLDSHPGVRKWVKNERLGFFIPYRNKGLPARYVPDFIVETDADLNVIVEIKGQVNDLADAKAKAALRWANAVNHLAQHGTWHYLLVTDPGTVGKALNSYTTAKWDQGQFELR